MSDTLLNVPGYFHREYDHDIPKADTENSQALRVVKVALPYVALYRPFGMALSAGLGSVRTVTNIRDSLSAKDFGGLSWSVLQTGLSLASVAGAVFLHPLGMLISTFGDIAENTHLVYLAMVNGDMSGVAKQTMRVANNSLYLAVILSGSLQLQLLSLVTQAVIEGSSSWEEFNKGNILEMVGHLGMSLIRVNQSHAMLGVMSDEPLYGHRAIEQIDAESADPSPKTEGEKVAYRAISKYDQGQEHPVISELKEQLGDQLNPLSGSFDENFHLYEDEANNLKGVWLCDHGGWNFTVRSAHYDPETKLWSQPEDQLVNLASHFPYGEKIASASRDRIFLEVHLNSGGNVGALCAHHDNFLFGPGTVEVTIFDPSSQKAGASSQSRLEKMPQFAGNMVATLGMDEQGNAAAVWYDPKSKCLDALHYSSKEGSWLTKETISSGGRVDQVDLFPRPSSGMVAIWKQKDQGRFFGDKLTIRDSIKSSSLSFEEGAWEAPLEVTPSDSLRFRTIEDLQFKTDANGDVVAVWEEAGGGDLRDVLDIIQLAKLFPMQMIDEFELEKYAKKSSAAKREIDKFLDPMMSTEDWIRDLTGYKGPIDLKEFYKLNPCSWNYTVSASVLDTKKMKWNVPTQLSSHGRDPVLKKNLDGKLVVKMRAAYDHEAEPTITISDIPAEVWMSELWGDEMDQEVSMEPQVKTYDPKTKRWI